ncbi:MAG TPA: serine hydrolase domain-containing protein [Flavobacterium sp.]|jgi:D-alanyl-D-alanine carboxypeptidase
MKKIILKITVALALAIGITSCNDDNDEPAVDACAASAGVNPSHPKAAAFQAILDEYVQKGLPGLVLYVKTPQGVWTGAAGKSNIETGELMRPCNLVYSQSIAKTFTAVSVMKLVEEGQVGLDAPVNTYLPSSLYSSIANFNQATVRQLLNHTSGIRSYTDEPEYLSEVLENGAQGMTTQKNLEYVFGKPALFEPGTDFTYSNTNYLLLGRIIDHVTGASHADFFTNRIFRPLGLRDIYYKNEPGYPAPAGLPNTYRDLGSGVLTNVTDIEIKILANDYGEGGILGLASNYAKFLEAIFKGNLVSPASRVAMTAWIEMPNPFLLNSYYGLGLLKTSTPFGTAIGHLGDGAGCSSYMFYFPDLDITIVMGTNKGVVTLEDNQLYRVELLNEVVGTALVN